MFSIPDMRHSPGVVYCHLLERRENRFPDFAPCPFRKEIWDLIVGVRK